MKVQHNVKRRIRYLQMMIDHCTRKAHQFRHDTDVMLFWQRAASEFERRLLSTPLF